MYSAGDAMKTEISRNTKRAGRIAADILYDIAGSILYAAGIWTFAKNADFAPGGISGLSLILNHLWGFPLGLTTLLLNVPLAVISYRVIGRGFLLKTAVSMLISTLFLDIIFPAFPIYRGHRILAAVYSGACLGAGMALFYMHGSSSGGIDFVAMVVKKKKPYFSLGVITMIIDIVIIALGWPAFGDVDSVLYGVASTAVSTIVVDKILYGIAAGTLAIIITGRGKAAARQISEVTERGVTIVRGTGSYTGESREVLLCACSKSEAYRVKNAVLEVDESAFLMFTETSEVFGEGFMGKKI